MKMIVALSLHEHTGLGEMSGLVGDSLAAVIT